jgi:hypothetical protein
MAAVAPVLTINAATRAMIGVERTFDRRPAFGVRTQRAEDIFVVASRIAQPGPIETLDSLPSSERRRNELIFWDLESIVEPLEARGSGSAPRNLLGISASFHKCRITR